MRLLAENSIERSRKKIFSLENSIRTVEEKRDGAGADTHTQKRNGDRDTHKKRLSSFVYVPFKTEVGQTHIHKKDTDMDTGQRHRHTDTQT